MSAMTLPALNPTPIPTLMVAPPSPAAGNAAGPGSFSRLLRAADAHRQPEAPEAAASPPPNPQSKAQNTTNGTRPPPPTQKAPSREGSKTERAAGQADADNNTAERRRAEEADAASAAEECTAPTDAASLLASLGLTSRANPALAATEASATRGRGGPGRQALEPGADATHGRAGPAADAASAAGALAADLRADDTATDRSAAGKTFAGLLAAAQGAAPGAEAATGSTAALAVAEQRLAPQAEARPADPSALGALLGPGVAPAAPAAGSSASFPAEARLGTTPGQAGFAEQLGAQLSTFMREGVQHARLQLHPLELGPVTVQIQLDGGSAHLSFAAEHALTRQALEQALPALAGSLREAGLTLSGGGVFEQPRQPQPYGDGGRGDGTGSRGGRGNTGSGDDALKAPAPGPALRRRGVVDLVA